jgi:hypothetical protein
MQDPAWKDKKYDYETHNAPDVSSTASDDDTGLVVDVNIMMFRTTKVLQ